MKKTLIWTLVLIFATAFVFLPSVFASFFTEEGINQNPALISAVDNTQKINDEDLSEEELSDDLERILSPEQISMFNNVIKKGKDLFGIRKESNEENKNRMTVREQNQERIIEKIAAPQFVNMYEHIRQVGNALWGEKKDDTKNESDNQNIADRFEELKEEIHIQAPSDLSFFTNIKKTIDGRMFGILKEDKEVPEKYKEREANFSSVSEGEKNCVVGAITEKDASIQANNLKFAEDLNNSIKTRNLCQIEALNKTSDLQKEAITSCNLEFNKIQEQVRKQTRETQENFWGTYKENLSSCRTQATSASPIIIEDGGDDMYE